MIRYDDEHVSVRLSDEGLRQAYGRSEYLRIADVKRIETLHAFVACVAVCGLGMVIGWSTVFGN